MTRTDPHRPGAIVPADYDFVVWYAVATVINGWPQPSCNIDRIIVLQRDQAVRWALNGSLGSCTVCGSGFVYGEVWKHRPSGEHIHVGHICADKYALVADRSEGNAWHEAQKRERAVVVLARERESRRDAFVAATQGLGDALTVEHPILRDMAMKLLRYGSLSDRQVAFALKLAEEVRNPPPPERLVAAPIGRQTVRGIVVSVKTHETRFGPTVKMTVKVETPEGMWLVWTTVPSAISDVARGQKVEFMATLESGREEHFVFGKRPTRARVLSEEA